jgi:hypothetical protein
MTIDERLEKLVERHEALAQTVELLTQDVQAFLATQKQHEQWLLLLTKLLAKHDERLDSLEGKSGE